MDTPIRSKYLPSTPLQWHSPPFRRGKLTATSSASRRWYHSRPDNCPLRCYIEFNGFIEMERRKERKVKSKCAVPAKVRAVLIEINVRIESDRRRERVKSRVSRCNSVPSAALRHRVVQHGAVLTVSPPSLSGHLLSSFPALFLSLLLLLSFLSPFSFLSLSQFAPGAISTVP